MAAATSGVFARLERAIERNKPDPLTSVVLTVPVFVGYHLGVLLIDVRSGLDWVSALMLELVDQNVPAYVGVTLAAAALLVCAAWIQRRRGRLRPAALFPTLAESSLWAVSMAIAVGWATHKVAAAAGVAAELGPFERAVLALGAGFHEEAVFRVGMLSGGALALRRFAGMGRMPAFLLVLPLSALAFALAHHLGPYAEAIDVTALAFRTLSGVFLSIVYVARGFAVAVYTHSIYDVLVFFVL